MQQRNKAVKHLGIQLDNRLFMFNIHTEFQNEYLFRYLQGLIYKTKVQTSQPMNQR